MLGGWPLSAVKWLWLWLWTAKAAILSEEFGVWVDWQDVLANWLGRWTEGI